MTITAGDLSKASEFALSQSSVSSVLFERDTSESSNCLTRRRAKSWSSRLKLRNAEVREAGSIVALMKHLLLIAAGRQEISSGKAGGQHTHAAVFP